MPKETEHDGKSFGEALLESPEGGTWKDAPEKPRSSVDVNASLFVLTVRGTLAKMFMLRQTDPSHEQWQMLNGGREITMRDLGEIAGELDFELDFRVTDNRPHDPDF